MKRALFVLVDSLLAVFVGAQPAAINPSMAINAPYGVPKVDCPLCELVVHERYGLLYDHDLQEARWVSYCVTKADILGTATREDNFREDPTIHGEQGELDDYKGTGYDRGHMRPAGDTKGTPEQMSETFYLSNMLPQTGTLNRGQWAALEDQVRTWVSTRDEVIVICGPAYVPGRKHKEIAEGVDVPDYCWKVVVSASPENPADLQTIAFLMPNRAEDIPKFA